MNALKASHESCPAGRRQGGNGLLAEITAGVSASAALHEVLQRFLEPVVRLAGADAGAVRVLAGDDEERLQLIGQIGLPAALCEGERSVDRHCGYCGQAADTQRVVWAGDLLSCARAMPSIDAAWRMLAVPLQHRGRVLGVYNLFYEGAAAPEPGVEGMLRSVGDLLGLALHNARLEAEHLRASLLKERAVMAAEVHDSVAQTLSFVKMRLPLLQDALLAHDDARSCRYLADVRQAVGDAHASLREIIDHLRARIDPRGLGPALDALAARFAERSGIALEYGNRLPLLTLGPERDTELYRVVQEALANIERHAGAQRAWLRLQPAEAGGVELQVDDDGVGLDGNAPAAEGHHGLSIMRDRAERLGARFAVQRRPGGGTRVRLVVPAAAEGGR